MKKAASIIFLILILIFPLSQGTAARKTPVLAQENPEKAYENVLCSAVCIYGNGYYGSGNILEIKDKEIVIATNKHIAMYFDDNSQIIFFNGAAYSGRLLGNSDHADVGFISVSAKELDQDTWNRIKAVNIQEEVYEGLKENSCFFMIDLASDINNPSLYKGVLVDKEKFLTDYGMEMLYGNGTAIPGMSGSGIFDYYGNYIGILSGATKQYELAAVPLKTILSEYEKCNK